MERRTGHRKLYDVEAELIACFKALRLSEDSYGRTAWARKIGELVSIPLQKQLDPRIQLAVSRMRESGNEMHLRQCAGIMNLSPDRARHLIRESLGVSFRQFRNWMRIRNMLVLVSAGANFTVASNEVGFASPSHFSQTFAAMFGISPTQAVKQSQSLPQVIVV